MLNWHEPEVVQVMHLAQAPEVLGKIPAREVCMETSPKAGLKRQERNTFLLLAVVLFPVLAVIFVASYGFVVWFWQMFVSGPPGH